MYSPINSLSHNYNNNSYILSEVIFIYKEIIRKHIDKLCINDLEKFALKNNINYTQDELIIIYNFIKYNYNDLLGENIKVFEQIKDKINPVLYKKILNLYIEYKQKYL